MIIDSHIKTAIAKALAVEFDGKKIRLAKKVGAKSSGVVGQWLGTSKQKASHVSDEYWPRLREIIAKYLPGGHPAKGQPGGFNCALILDLNSAWPFLSEPAKAMVSAVIVAALRDLNR